MTVIFTTDQIAAATELRDSCARLHDALDHEPTDFGLAWANWNDREYQPAWTRHEYAESRWKLMWPKGHAPHTVDVVDAKPLNPLRETLCAGVFKTSDDRFYASAYVPGRAKEGLWQVVHYADGYDGRTDRARRVDGRDQAHAQQIVDLITWATTDGDRNGAN